MKLPCGCVMWRDGEIFYVKPHSLDCEFYLYAIEQSHKRGNKIEFRGSTEELEKAERERLIASRPNLGPPKYRWRKDSHSIRG